MHNKVPAAAARRRFCQACLALAAGAVAKRAVSAALADASAPVVFYNAQVFTAEYDHPYAEAVAIRGDRIIAVGTLASAERIAGPTARKVDVHGKFLMPGFIDAHTHPVLAGITMVQANFPERASVATLVQFVADEMRKRESMRGDVLMINNVDPTYWTHASEIDAALSHETFAAQPIVLLGSDVHSAWANQAARVRAGITQEFIRNLEPSNRQDYGFDSEFNPNGFVVDAGRFKLEGSLPPFSADFLLRAGRAAVHYLNGLGITGWLDAAVTGFSGGALRASIDDPGYLPVYQDLARRGELTALVAAFPVVDPALGTPQIDVVEALRAKFKGVPNLTVPGIKVFADGVAEAPAETAALTKPYTDTGHSAPVWFTPAKMNALVTEAARRGLSVHVHAIGDLAVRATLDAFEVARTAVPQSTSPFALAHARFVDPQDIPRFAQLQVIAVMELLWASPEAAGGVKPYIDPEIYHWMHPARSILDTGGEIAGSSDWPVASPNPLLAINVAETRTTKQGGVLDAEQRVPREAMPTHTRAMPHTF